MLYLMLWITLGIVVGLLAGAGVIHVLARDKDGWFCRWSSQAPGLDLWLVFFGVTPYIAAGVVLGTATDDGAYSAWMLVGCTLVCGVLGQAVALASWIRLHELFNRRHMKGPRLVTQINRSVGALRNYVAVWYTSLAVPVFLLVRLAECVVYPPLTWLIGLPRYNAREWVSVSRYKFEGLVGGDLIWCLYCDWMTGVWSLGTEMLRNIESFWCPLRFNHPEKCENCKIDFPDVEDGWAPADATMQDLADVHARYYPGPNGVNAWFGHPVRITRDGVPIEQEQQ